MEEKIKKEVQFLIFLDDDDKKKEKYAIIKEEEFWVHIQLYDIVKKEEYGKPFKIPKTRILKIRTVQND